jgi:hypothetical protein
MLSESVRCYLPLQNLHKRPAKERDRNHRQPRGHLSEAPGNVGIRDSQTELLKFAVERVEDALVGRDFLNLVADNEVLEGLRRGAGAVQGLVADGRNRRRLVREGLGNGEVVERRRADRPRVAEDALHLTVEVGKLGRIRLGRQNGERGLSHVSTDEKGGRHAPTFQALVALPHSPKHVLLPPVMKTNQSCVVGGLAVGSTVSTSFQFSRVMVCWTAAAALAAALSVAALMGAEGTAGMEEDTAAVALLKNPLTLSSSGICCSAAASAGRASTTVDEKRIVAMWCVVKECCLGGRVVVGNVR